VSAAFVASPAVALADPDESGSSPPSTGETQSVANDQPTGVDPGSSNNSDPSPSEETAGGEEVLEEVGGSIVIEQGSSPTVVISSSGGAHTSSDDRPTIRKRAVPADAPAPAEAPAPAAMQVAVAEGEHDHGGGDPNPGGGGNNPGGQQPAAFPPPGPVTQVVAAVAPAVRPMVSPAFDPLLALYADFLLPQKTDLPATADPYDRILANWNGKLAIEDTATFCKNNPTSHSCHMDMGTGPAEGPVPQLISLWKGAMAPMAPMMNPLLTAYADNVSLMESNPNAAPLDRIVDMWTMKLNHESAEAKLHMDAMMRNCKADSRSQDCIDMAKMSGGGGHAGHGSHGSGHGNHGGHGGHGNHATMTAAEAAVAATYNDHDVMFLNHMIPHHGQAVLMSRIVLDKPDLDPRVAALAAQIKGAQGPEIRMMEGWLDEWGNPPSDMVGDHGILPGEDIAALRKASGPDASVLFLQQMIYHHNGAVDASVGHLQGGQYEPSLELASEIITAQRTEITTMNELLASLGATTTGPNVPTATSGGGAPQPSSGSATGSGGHGGGGHHH
jgi:uncharacterized protein (DUF305 family)